ncbi:aminoglycoside phosphotransferase family protein [Nonomuraea typhae]|uniref:phosphotransferase n=1 Tax=Nonomuraea typhae TaxID=2603600 RepID=UPI0012F9A70C|nr:aminoglycoside phosphotransferase family protein [Nonomuraea typhae]
MTPAKTPPAEAACRLLGLDSTGMRLLHLRANAVFHLPAAEAVLRLRYAPGNTTVAARLHTAVTVTRWLAQQGFPTITPLAVDQPAGIDGWLATAWYHVPQMAGRAASPEELATIIRTLHTMSLPPIALPRLQPLGSLRADLHAMDPASAPVDPGQAVWLVRRCDYLEQALPALMAELDHGLLHGDAHTGNLFGAPGRWRLGDWDSVSHGPLLQDAIPTLIGHRRFDRPRTRWIGFCRAYGLDPEVETAPVTHLLAEARELRSLASYIRAADHTAIHSELQRRLDSLMNNEPCTWHFI